MIMLQKDIDKFNYQLMKENQIFWNRIGQKPSFMNKTVLDLGLGHGALSVHIASCGASKIIGLDPNSHLIEFAKKNLEINYEKYINSSQFH